MPLSLPSHGWGQRFDPSSTHHKSNTYREPPAQVRKKCESTGRRIVPLLALVLSLLLEGCVVAINPSINFCGSDGDLVKPKASGTPDDSR
jgi:hypothetical protein